MVKGSFDIWVCVMVFGKVMLYIVFENVGVKYIGLSLVLFVFFVILEWLFIFAGIGLFGCKVEVRRCFIVLL